MKKNTKYLIFGIIGLAILFMFIFGNDTKQTKGTDGWSKLTALFDNNKDSNTKDNQEPEYSLSGIDGPYIFDNISYRVNSKNQLEETKINRNDSFLVQANNEDLDSFYFKLKKEINSSPDIYDMPKKLVAMSDIEGNFNAFSSLLKNNNIIDDNYNWIFGDGHLVIVGDLIDRDSNVLPILWLAYKLEDQAKAANGKVHIIIGNHEIMNFQGKYKYNAEKYKAIAKLIFEKNHKGIDSKETNQSDYTKFLYSNKSELGRWLQSKNGIEKIGSYIFVHAGLSPEILDYNMSIPEINKISRNNWDKNLYHHPQENEKANFLIGRKGIFWYRGFFKKYKTYYDKITEQELDKILAYYKVQKMVIGHTIITDDIIKIFHGKVIDIDLHHSKQKNSGKTLGLLIENGIEYKIDDKGKKVRL